MMYHVDNNCENCQIRCGLHAPGRPWRVCIYAVIQLQEEVLLVKPSGGGEWTLPGGMVPVDMLPEEALRNSVLRSTGLELLMRVQPYVRECPHRHHFLVYREAAPTAWSMNSISPEKDPDMVTEWFPVTRLPLKMAQHAKSYLFHERNTHAAEPALHKVS